MKIAIVNLLPDSGHVIPLLKIAKVLMENNIEIKYFGISETRELVTEYKIPSEFIGAVRPSNYRAELSKLCNSHPLSRQIIFGKLFFINYAEKLAYNGIRKSNELKLKILNYDPDLLIADEHHLFTKIYTMFAKELNAPLILNDAMGSGFNQQNKYLRHEENFGLLINKSLSFLKKISGKSYSLFMKIFYAPTLKENNAIHDYIAEYEMLCKNSNLEIVKIIHVSFGAGALERKYLARKISIDKKIMQFGPIPIHTTGELTEELAEWLDNKNLPPIIYVGFGTMVSGNFQFSSTLIQAVKKLGFRMLWVHPEQPRQDCIESHDHFKWAKWGPQTKILAHPNIKLFITHAGSGAVQEALWFAKPMVCIPFIWDQPYNAWVMSELGCGIIAKKSLLTEQAISSSILQALNLKPQCDLISNEFRNMESTNDILKLIKNIEYA